MDKMLQASSLPVPSVLGEICNYLFKRPVALADKGVATFSNALTAAFCLLYTCVYPMEGHFSHLAMAFVQKDIAWVIFSHVPQKGMPPFSQWKKVFVTFTVTLANRDTVLAH